MPVKVQEASKTLNRHDQNRISPQHITVKIITTENKKRILRVAREKNQIVYQGKFIKITADLLAETLEARRAWSEVF
jgi:hypothetical protein